jgi:hypothetical protein
MPTHDIIDNRKEKLVDHINRILSSTESARFAVGYFFLSGLESIAQRLAGVKELRLLIGNTTNRETLEQLAEGYRRLDLVAEAAEAEAYPKRTEIKRMASETAGSIRSGIELMDQTDEAQAVVATLVRMVEEKRLAATSEEIHARAVGAGGSGGRQSPRRRRAGGRYQWSLRCSEPCEPRPEYYLKLFHRQTKRTGRHRARGGKVEVHSLRSEVLKLGGRNPVRRAGKEWTRAVEVAQTGT